MSYYFWILLGTIAGPFLLSFDKKVHFYTHWKSFLIATVIVATGFLIWDEYFTQLKVWGFTPKYLSGIYFGHLPLEEVFDPTGAGDTFAGGFVAHLAKTKDISFENMKSAIILGSAMASFCVEKFGTERLTEINVEDIKERVQSFVQLVNFDIELV